MIISKYNIGDNVRLILTKRYDWQRLYDDGWQDEEYCNVECIRLAMNYHFKLRYREVEKRTVEDIAKSYTYQNYDKDSIVFCDHIRLAFNVGFRAGRSKDYDDVELDT